MAILDKPNSRNQKYVAIKYKKANLILDLMPKPQVRHQVNLMLNKSIPFNPL